MPQTRGIHNCDVLYLVIWLTFCFAGVFVAGFYAGQLSLDIGPILLVPMVLAALFLVFIAFLFTVLISKGKSSCVTETNINQRRSTQLNVPSHLHHETSTSLGGHTSYRNTEQPPRNVSHSTVNIQQRYGGSGLHTSRISYIVPRAAPDDMLPSYDDVIRKEDAEERV